MSESSDSSEASGLSYSFPCPGCGAKLGVKSPASVGKQNRCPKCRTKFAVPSPGEPAAMVEAGDADIIAAERARRTAKKAKTSKPKTPRTPKTPPKPPSRSAAPPVVTASDDWGDLDDESVDFDDLDKGTVPVADEPDDELDSMLSGLDDALGDDVPAGDLPPVPGMNLKMRKKLASTPSHSLKDPRYAPKSDGRSPLSGPLGIGLGAVGLLVLLGVGAWAASSFGLFGGGDEVLVAGSDVDPDNDAGEEPDAADQAEAATGETAAADPAIKPPAEQVASTYAPGPIPENVPEPVAGTALRDPARFYRFQYWALDRVAKACQTHFDENIRSDGDGKLVDTPNPAPQLSWRVHILPHLGYEQLYDRFALDEPWDSPTNRKLLSEMPPEYHLIKTPLPPGQTTLVRAIVPDQPEQTFWAGPYSKLAGRPADNPFEIQPDAIGPPRVPAAFVALGPEVAIEWTRPVDWHSDRGERVGSAPLKAYGANGDRAVYPVGYFDGSVGVILQPDGLSGSEGKRRLVAEAIVGKSGSPAVSDRAVTLAEAVGRREAEKFEKFAAEMGGQGLGQYRGTYIAEMQQDHKLAESLRLAMEPGPGYDPGPTLAAPVITLNRRAEPAQPMLPVQPSVRACLQVQRIQKAWVDWYAAITKTTLGDDGYYHSTPNPSPGLSWRVHILPYMNQQKLYDKFDLSKPWDDPHNLALVDLLPPEFEIDGITLPTGFTNVLAIASDETLHEGPYGKLEGRSPDNPYGYTDQRVAIFVVAGPDVAVPWTKPADAVFDADDRQKSPAPLGSPSILIQRDPGYLLGSTEAQSTLGDRYVPWDSGDVIHQRAVPGAPPAWDVYPMQMAFEGKAREQVRGRDIQGKIDFVASMVVRSGELTAAHNKRGGFTMDDVKAGEAIVADPRQLKMLAAGRQPPAGMTPEGARETRAMPAEIASAAPPAAEVQQAPPARPERTQRTQSELLDAIALPEGYDPRQLRQSDALLTEFVNRAPRWLARDGRRGKEFFGAIQKVLPSVFASRPEDDTAIRQGERPIDRRPMIELLRQKVTEQTEDFDPLLQKIDDGTATPADEEIAFRMLAARWRYDLIRRRRVGFQGQYMDRLVSDVMNDRKAEARRIRKIEEAIFGPLALTAADAQKSYGTIDTLAQWASANGVMPEAVRETPPGSVPQVAATPQEVAAGDAANVEMVADGPPVADSGVAAAGVAAAVEERPLPDLTDLLAEVNAARIDIPDGELKVSPTLLAASRLQVESQHGGIDATRMYDTLDRVRGLVPVWLGATAEQDARFRRGQMVDRSAAIRLLVQAMALIDRERKAERVLRHGKSLPLPLRDEMGYQMLLSAWRMELGEWLTRQPGAPNIPQVSSESGGSGDAMMKAIGDGLAQIDTDKARLIRQIEEALFGPRALGQPLAAKGAGEKLASVEVVPFDGLPQQFVGPDGRPALPPSLVPLVAACETIEHPPAGSLRPSATIVSLFLEENKDVGVDYGNPVTTNDLESLRTFAPRAFLLTPEQEARVRAGESIGREPEVALVLEAIRVLGVPMRGNREDYLVRTWRQKAPTEREYGYHVMLAEWRSELARRLEVDRTTDASVVALAGALALKQDAAADIVAAVEKAVFGPRALGQPLMLDGADQKLSDAERLPASELPKVSATKPAPQAAPVAAAAPVKDPAPVADPAPASVVQTAEPAATPPKRTLTAADYEPFPDEPYTEADLLAMVQPLDLDPAELSLSPRLLQQSLAATQPPVDGRVETLLAKTERNPGNAERCAQAQFLVPWLFATTPELELRLAENRETKPDRRIAYQLLRKVTDLQREFPVRFETTPAGRHGMVIRDRLNRIVVEEVRGFRERAVHWRQSLLMRRGLPLEAASMPKLIADLKAATDDEAAEIRRIEDAVFGTLSLFAQPSGPAPLPKVAAITLPFDWIKENRPPLAPVITGVRPHDPVDLAPLLAALPKPAVPDEPLVLSDLMVSRMGAWRKPDLYVVPEKVVNELKETQTFCPTYAAVTLEQNRTLNDGGIIDYSAAMALIEAVKSDLRLGAKVFRPSARELTQNGFTPERYEVFTFHGELQMWRRDLKTNLLGRSFQPESPDQLLDAMAAKLAARTDRDAVRFRQVEAALFGKRRLGGEKMHDGPDPPKLVLRQPSAEEAAEFLRNKLNGTDAQ